MAEFKVWWPDEGETEADAIDILGCFDHEQAADQAAEYDYDNRDGWERTECEEYPVCIKDVDTGEVQRFMCWWEPSVNYGSRRAEEAPRG